MSAVYALDGRPQWRGQELRVRCRWCRRWMSPRARAQHEPGCLADRRAWVDRNLAHAAERVEELRVAEWYRLRWRGLPGRGWGALAGSYQLLKVEEVRR